MNKKSFWGSLALLSGIIVFVIVGCQKDQVSSNAQKEEISESANISRAVGAKNIPGLITESIADELQSEYLRLNPTASTLKVGYATKELIEYLNQISGKFGSDSVFVTFGAYNKSNAPNKAQVGRTTIFFMGNKFKSKKKNNSGVKSLGDSDSDINDKDFLNHGAMIP